MHVCYVDEAGCLGSLPHAMSPIQPALAVMGLVVDVTKVRPLTTEFMHLKQRFYPQILQTQTHYLDTLQHEVKGADLRKNIIRGTRDERRHSIGLLDKTIGLLQKYGARIFGKIQIKAVGQQFLGRAAYTSSVQMICRCFQEFLQQEGAEGLVVADSRDKGKNANVSHSIFTQKYQAGGDPFPRILEVPTFGHSDNHSGLQLADWICSGMVFPMSTLVYCTGHVNNVHVQPRASIIRERYGKHLRALQYRYWDAQGARMRGGLTVSDQIARRSGSLLLPPQTARLPVTA